MINTAKTAAAASLAQRAHSGQLDKAGESYVKHAFAVAEKMDDEDSTCAALLHDVVEDTDFTLDDLRAIGMSEAVVEAVDLLTRGPDQDYFAYVLALRDHPIASKVKRADLEHNADLSRFKRLTSFDMRRRAKYLEALALLDGDVEGCKLACNRDALRALGLGGAPKPPAPPHQ